MRYTFSTRQKHATMCFIDWQGLSQRCSMPGTQSLQVLTFITLHSLYLVCNTVQACAAGWRAPVSWLDNRDWVADSGRGVLQHGAGHRYAIKKQCWGSFMLVLIDCLCPCHRQWTPTCPDATSSPGAAQGAGPLCVRGSSPTPISPAPATAGGTRGPAGAAGGDASMGLGSCR
jgi:hypothetical protein